MSRSDQENCADPLCLDERQLMRTALLLASRGLSSDAPCACALLDWARSQRDWLAIDKHAKDKWKGLISAARSPCQACDAHTTPYALTLTRSLGDALGFDRFDTQLMIIVVAYERLAQLSTLIDTLGEQGFDLPMLFGEMAGAERQDAARMVRRSTPLRLGLLKFRANRKNMVIPTWGGRWRDCSTARQILVTRWSMRSSVLVSRRTSRSPISRPILK